MKRQDNPSPFPAIYLKVASACRFLYDLNKANTREPHQTASKQPPITII